MLPSCAFSSSFVFSYSSASPPSGTSGKPCTSLVGITTDVAFKFSLVAVKVISPLPRLLFTHTASCPPFVVTVFGPTTSPGPSTSKFTSVYALGTTVPFLSVISIHTSFALLPSNGTFASLSGRS